MTKVFTPIRLLALSQLLVLGWAAAAAPPVRPDMWAWVKLTLSGYWIGQESWLVAVFWLLGITPVMLAGLVRDQLFARPVPCAPFVLSAMALGGFAFLPWVIVSGDALRAQEQTTAGAPERTLPLEAIGGRRWGQLVALPALLALGSGVVWGDPLGYLAFARGEGFAFVMTADFVALWLVSVALCFRRSRSRLWLVSMIPVAGPAIWMALGRR